jgi:hypothetical protein
MRIPSPPLRIVFALLAGFLVLLVIILARILEVRGILQARDVNILLVALVVLLLFLPYILVPIYLHRRHWLSANHDHEEMHPAREAVPEEVWSHARETIASLSPCGFKLVGHFRKLGTAHGAIAFVTLLQDKDQLTVAKVITILTTGQERLAERVLGLSTELADGREIVSTNRRESSLLPHAKKQLVLWLPDVRDPRDLYDFHKRLTERFGDAQKCLSLNGKHAEYLNQRTQAEVAHWVEEGYHKLDSGAQVYRLTWKGAALIGWKHLWPIKPIRRAWRRYQTNKLLRKLEE